MSLKLLEKVKEIITIFGLVDFSILFFLSQTVLAKFVGKQKQTNKNQLLVS